MSRTVWLMEFSKDHVCVYCCKVFKKPTRSGCNNVLTFQALNNTSGFPYGKSREKKDHKLIQNTS